MNSNEMGKMIELSLRDWQEKLWKTHTTKGWDKINRSPLENHALIVTEIAEATEAVRNGEPGFWINEGKPEGEFVEIADVIIRCINYLTANNQDVETLLDAKDNYNKTRGQLHGKEI